MIKFSNGRRFSRVVAVGAVGLLTSLYSHAATKPDLASAEYQLFLVGGQSNAQGWIGENEEGLNEPVPIPEPGTVFYYNADTKQILDASTASKKDYVGAFAGFHNRFAIDYHKATGKKVIFLHEVHGNSGVIPGLEYGGGNWSDTYRAAMKEKYEAFKAVAAETPQFAGKWALGGLIWGQGEAECGYFENKSKTLPEAEAALSSLFDGFAQDYGADYTGKPDKLIKVVLVSVFAFPNMRSDKFYPDSPEWAMTRDMQRDVAKKNPNARMVYFAIEKIFGEGVWPNNAVHYYQKQYNEIGRLMAQEIAKPGSTVKEPKVATNLTAKDNGAWRVDLAWQEPEGGVPGELWGYRVYRRKAGEKDWTWIWQTQTQSMQDETRTEPDTEYQYRIGTRNEFDEVFTEPVSAKTGKLVEDPVADYVKLAKPAKAAEVKALWKALEAGGHTKGLRSLYLMVSDLNSASGGIYNLVAQAGGEAVRVDFTVDKEDGLKREASGYEFSSLSHASTEKPLIPVHGPFTLMFDANWTQLPEGEDSYGFLAQGRGYPAPPENSRSMVFFDPKSKQIKFYHEDQTSELQTKGAEIAAGQPNTYALTYNGLNLSWLQSGQEPVTHDNTIYFYNFWDSGFEIFNGPTNEKAGTYRMPYLATWNRALSPEEFAAVKALLDKYLGLAK